MSAFPPDRTVFRIPRTLEFFTESELSKELGVPRSDWGRAILKELLDNALDACEYVGRSPLITVAEDQAAHTLAVRDNGPGLPVDILRQSLDYNTRVTDKAYYVSPSRGQQGHALKTLWALPYVLSGRREQGQVDVSVDGMRYEVRISVDHIAQAPQLALTPVPAPEVKSGTQVTIHWPQIANYAWLPERYFYFSGARDLVQRYALFNPHATFAYSNGEQVEYPASDPAWGKWTPRAPTSPHWYTPQQFQALLRALLNADRQTEAGARLVSEVLREFDGLSGSAARGEVLRPLGLSGAKVEALVDGVDLDPAMVGALLQTMQERVRPVKPKALGVLGDAHLRQALTIWHDVDPATIHYRALKETTEGLPYVVEVACGQRRPCVAGAGDDGEDDGEDAAGGEAAGGDQRLLLCGFNFTPALGVPFARLYDWLGTADITSEDGVALVVHVTCPRLEATDRGKTAVTLPSAVEQTMKTLLLKVAEPWTRLKKKIREEGRQQALEEAEERRKHRPMSTKAAAWQVMPAAYSKASNSGAWPANARQIMYAARPDIIRLTGKAKPWKHSSQFTQHLLPDFLEAHPELTATWDVVHDARGHFREPHAGYEFGLGTVEVRRYLGLWTKELERHVEVPTLPRRIITFGPTFRYKTALFIEKEGFDALFERAQIQDRYDLALMSTKGMTVTAARQLVEALSLAGVTILVLHDFDKSGIEILDKFTSDTRRYRYTVTPTVIDLGLRLEDAQAMGLESEPVTYASEVDPRVSLRECGATKAECDFLVRGGYSKNWHGERVELNAMDSQTFLDWLEQKLRDAGVAKVIPDQESLAVAYTTQRRVAKLQRLIDKAMEEPEEGAPVPDDLAARIGERITDKDTAWDAALWDIVREQLADEDDEDAT